MGLWEAPTGLKTIKEIYKKQCAKYRLTSLHGKPLYFDSREHCLPGRYFSALQSLSLQFASKGIRKSIQWRSLQDRSRRYGGDPRQWMFIYRHFIILKKGMDGYSLKGGRSIQLSTLTNCSIWGAENSTDATDVHYMADVDEDAYSRFIVDQVSDKELFLLKMMGIPDLATGAMIGVFVTQAEDSKSMQFAVGRGGATSNSRLIWTRFSWAHLASKWLTVFSPISFSGYDAHLNWKGFMREHLRRKCLLDFPHVIPELVPFAKSMLCPQIGVHRREYLEAYKWMKTKMKFAKLQVSDWCCAESIRVKPPEPLHLTLRVPIIVLKWYFLHTLEYCEWINQPKNASFKEKNHQCADYHVHDRAELLHHFRDCLGIPLSFDADNPGKSSIAANGAWRRKVWNHLEEAVICRKCGFRPWKGSPVEKLYLLMFINLIEVMVPLEILDHNLYQEYWSRYLKFKFIDAGNQSVNYENANVWSVHAQHFFTLFMTLMGPNRMTRYIHGMVFCTMHGFELAHALKSTYRALFGSDVVERMNSVTKSVLHCASSRFGGKKRDDQCLAERTTSQIIKWLIWDRYEFREKSPRLNLRYRLNNVLIWNQRNRDFFNMNMANRMRQRCERYGDQYGYTLKMDCPLSNEYQREGTFARMKQHPTVINFYSTEELIPAASDIVDHEADRIRSGLINVIHNFEPISDTLEVITQSENFAEWDEEKEDDFDFDESTLKKRFPKIIAVALQEDEGDGVDEEEKEESASVSESNHNVRNQEVEQKEESATVSESNHNVQNQGVEQKEESANGSSSNHNGRNQGNDSMLNRIRRLSEPSASSVSSTRLRNRCSNRHSFISQIDENTLIRWKPLNILIRPSDWNFGANWIKLTTAITVKKKRVNLWLTWQYQQLRYITVHEQGDHIGIWMKFTGEPEVQKKVGKEWPTVDTNHLPEQLLPLKRNGKLSLWLTNDIVEFTDIMLLVTKYKYFTLEHQLSTTAYAAVPTGYSTAEYQAAFNAFRGSKSPIMREHIKLLQEVEATFKSHRCGNKRACAACKKPHSVFGRHVLCMKMKTDGNAEAWNEAGNVTKHVCERLLYDNDPEATTASVRKLADPLSKSVRTRACSVIQSDAELWGSVVFIMYLSFVEYILEHKRGLLLNCVEDADYQGLSCPGKQFIILLNRAMIESLQKNQRSEEELGDRALIITKLITVVSDMFILPQQCEDTRDLQTKKRIKLWKSHKFSVRLRNHFRLCDIATHSAFIFLFRSFAEEITGDSNIWTFVHYLKSD